MKEKISINQIIKALIELEAKGCHAVFFEYGNGLFRVRIFRGEASIENIVYEKAINPMRQQTELNVLANLVETLSNRVFVTVFQCYRRVFVKGEKSGNWEKTKPAFEFDDNSGFSMLMDGSGYYLDDTDRGLQYFVDMKQLSETN